MPLRAFRQVLFLIASSQLLVAQTPSVISLSTSPNPSAYGAPVTIRATVTPSGATGRVTFYDGAAVLGASVVSGGQALFTTRLLGPGTRILRAHYSGGGGYSPGDSAILTQSVSHAVRTVPDRPRTAAASTPGPYLISTVAGLAFPPTSMPGASAVLRDPEAVATDAAGNVYFSDKVMNMVFRLDLSGTLTRVAGNGLAGDTGDNGPALSAQFWRPYGLALDASGNLYVADSSNCRVRRFAPDGTIAAVAGTGCFDSGLGDNGPATSAFIQEPTGLAVDAAGNLFIADPGASRIRKVSTNGIITTVAGNGAAGYSGDNGPATRAQLNIPWGVAVDGSGNIFIADTSNLRIRKVSASGTITTVAGNGTYGYSGDNGPATSAQLQFPQAVAADASGNFYIGDLGSYRVRKVSLDGAIATVAGNGAIWFNGDGLEAIAAPLNPTGVALDPTGNLYIADFVNVRIRKISAGSIVTAAGGGSGDGAAAPMGMFVSPQSTVKDAVGNTYISDWEANRVHVITPSGAIATVAGTGVLGYSGDKGPAAHAQLSNPMGLAVDSSGALYIADAGNNRVRKIYGGTITTVAGTGIAGFSGDGSPGVSAKLWLPQGLAMDSLRNLYISEAGNNRIRRLSPDGTISTVAGIGTAGYSGDNGPATGAQLDYPGGIAVDGSGNLYIADEENQRIRKVAADGSITTIAGNGAAGYSGDGGPATAAQFNSPRAVSVDTAGNIYITDTNNNLIREVTTDGIVTTIAGGNIPYPFTPPVGDGPALGAYIAEPQSAMVDTTGNVYIADTINQVIRVLTPQGGPAILTISCAHSGAFQLGLAGQYTLTVSNLALAGPTIGTVTVSELIPSGMSVSSMSGNGWSCGTSTCTRNDTLASGASYPPISVAVRIFSTAPLQVTNQATVAGGGAATTGAQDLTSLWTPYFTIPTSIQTNPTGMQFSIDGVTGQTAPETLSLSPGSHTIAVASPQAGAPGTQYGFTGWSDSGTASHAITVTSGTAYTASFKTQYQLTTAALPEPGGIVSPATGSFFDAESNVTVSFIPTPPYTFNSWSGAASGSSNPVSITMNAAESVTANFGVPGFTCAVTGDATPSVADVQLIVNEALGVAPAVYDLNRDGVVNVADVQKVINAALGMGCLY